MVMLAHVRLESSNPGMWLGLHTIRLTVGRLTSGKADSG
jgi:hypothetical protein